MNIGTALRNFLNAPYDPNLVLAVNSDDAALASISEVALFNKMMALINPKMVWVQYTESQGYRFSVAGTHPMRAVTQGSWYGDINGTATILEMLDARGPTGARVSDAALEEHVIMSEYYHVVPETTLTICVLTLVNGFTVTGESACASPKNFDEVIGRTLARKMAKDKVWMLEGYVLRNSLMKQTAFHKKRGSTYVVEENWAELQTAAPIPEGTMLAVYRDIETGKLYARPETEFRDGRFEIK